MKRPLALPGFPIVALPVLSAEPAVQPGETAQMLLSLGKPKGIFLRSPRILTDNLLVQK